MEKLKTALKHICRWLVLLLIGVVLAIPLVLPYIVEFHPLLVTPYYGLLMWTTSLNYIAREHTSSIARIMFAQSKCKKGARKSDN